ncbi:hypothetical protein XaplCFBP3123_20560 [Xanthomonas arboricola pv. populi]|nr:hypothetical protein XaplCFBP3123_20560 [Xanthomonas arboricola pv. populi]
MMPAVFIGAGGGGGAWLRGAMRDRPRWYGALLQCCVVAPGYLVDELGDAFIADVVDGATSNGRTLIRPSGTFSRGEKGSVRVWLTEVERGTDAAGGVTAAR